MNKVVDTKASAEGTPPGNGELAPKDQQPDSNGDAAADREPNGEAIEEIEDQAHPFN